MSQQAGDSSPGVVRLGTDGQGRQILAAPYNRALAKQAVQKGIADQTQLKTDSESDRTTPDPAADADTEGGSRTKGGPIRRFNDLFTDLGSVQLEALGLDGFEVGRAISVRRDELYRNEFPLLVARFDRKCEVCDSEYNTDVSACLECSRRAMAEAESIRIVETPQDIEEIPERYRENQVRPPNPEQKRRAEQLFEKVNKEGQSLRELYRALEDDHSRLGIAAHIVKKQYAVAVGDTSVFSRGDVIHESIDELVRADPKRLRPVVDQNGRIGGYWWTCPIHRTDCEDGSISSAPGLCDKCGTELREVYFCETKHAGRSAKPEKFYFEDEVITWAHHFPRLSGLDGLSPIHHIWLKQAILHWMDVYGAAFYDPESDRYPNKFMVVHTTNADTWERNFQRAEEDAKENPYSQQIMMNEYAADSSSTPEVQIVDLMNDELLGQDEQIKKQFKSDIRAALGVTDVFDSELEDAGGLNNEGLQLEVTDRSIASAQHELIAGPLDTLAKRLGITDWRPTFIPPRSSEADETRAKVDLGGAAAQNGLDATWEDGEVEISDGEFEDPQGGGGLGGMMGGLGGGGEGGEPGPGGPQPSAGPSPQPTPGSGPGPGAGDQSPETLFAEFSDEDLETLTEKLDEAFEHIVWAEAVDQKASPFWDDDTVVPEFVKVAIKAAIDAGAVFADIKGIGEAEEEALADVLKEKLTEAAGWSLDSIADGIKDRFPDVDQEYAEELARTESASVLNDAREKGYRARGDTDSRKFKWLGPDDYRSTDCCQWMKEVTAKGAGPMVAEYGRPNSIDTMGEPVTLDDLEKLEREASARFFPDLDYRKHCLHPQERHSFTEDFGF